MNNFSNRKRLALAQSFHDLSNNLTKESADPSEYIGNAAPESSADWSAYIADECANCCEDGDYALQADCVADDGEELAEGLEADTDVAAEDD